MAVDRAFEAARVAGPGEAGRAVWLTRGAAGVVLLAYVPFFNGLATVSASNPYAGHVLFVPVLAAALLWLDRQGFRRLSAQGSPAGAGLIIAALLVVAFGYRTGSIALQGLSLVAAGAGLVLWLAGSAGLRRAGFVLGFLLLMVPPPRDVVSAFAPAIQRFVAAFSSVVLDALSIPVEHRGIFLYLPRMTLEVAEECAGLRFALILFVFVAAFARAVVPSVPLQLFLIALAIPIAMLTNAARVAATAVGAHVIGNHVVTGPLHYYIGKSFWAFALVAMIGVACFLRSQVALAGARRHPGRGTCMVDAR